MFDTVSAGQDEEALAEELFWASLDGQQDSSSDISDVPDTPQVGGRPVLTLTDIRKRVVPVSLAEDQRLPVALPLKPWLPKGLQRGSTVQVSGSGATSFLMMMVASAMQQGSWLAVVGQPSFGWLAAEQQGVPLHQVVAVPNPPPGSWGQVMAAAVDAFDLLLVSPVGVRSRDARRIEARARERGSVVLSLGQGWPRAADVQVQVELQRWAGLGWGYGHMSACWALVEAHGRGGQNHHVGELLVAGTEPRDSTVFVGPMFAGSDAHLLETDTQDRSAAVLPYPDNELRQVG